LPLLDKAIKANPKSVRLYHQRAELRARTGLDNLAVDDDTRAIDIEPDVPDYYEHRATILVRLKRLAEARKDRNRAHRLRNRDVTLLLPAHTDSRLPACVTPLINDRMALEKWKKAADKERPVLVVVAASGGGIAAAYWTAKCMARIEEKCPQFPSRLRVI